MTEEISLSPAFNLDEDERRIIVDALKIWWDKQSKDVSTHDLLIANSLIEMFSE